MTYDLIAIMRAEIEDHKARIAELEAALKERHRHHLKLELEKRAVEDIAEQFSKDKAEYYRYILRLEAALLRIGQPRKQIVYCRDGHEEAVLLARAAIEGEKE